MAGCCDHDDYQSVFSGRFARRQSKRYRRRGLTPAARDIVDFATSQGIAGATVLEIGGGVGHLHVELLRRGASRVTNLEISENYEGEAARVLEASGMSDTVAAGHARKALVYSHPADNVVNRAQFGAENLYRRLTRNDFRVFMHPPEDMVRAAESGRLRVAHRQQARHWDVVGLAR